MSSSARLLDGPLAAKAEGVDRSSLDAAVALVEARVAGIRGHSRRVSVYSALVAKRMGLTREEVSTIRRAALLHDVGKVEIPVEILNWPGPLGPKDLAMVRTHSVIGARMTACLDSEALTATVRHHHERLDGSGYPYGLRGEETPIGARIVAVTDTFDAVTSIRTYREALGRREGLRLLESEAGVTLDAKVVEAFRDNCSGLLSLLTTAIR
jgi:HD-GYP domain-containing protein (c-di-GMP phosphodiesterase class II)